MRKIEKKRAEYRQLATVILLYLQIIALGT
jgi:hypothetical protein